MLRLTGIDDADSAAAPGQRGRQALHPKLAIRSRCSTTITIADPSDKTPANFPRFPFRPDPTSAITCDTAKPLAAAH